MPRIAADVGSHIRDIMLSETLLNSLKVWKLATAAGQSSVGSCCYAAVDRPGHALIDETDAIARRCDGDPWRG
jgi:hypothetical protein